MSEALTREQEWAQPILEARLWWCEDELCDCYQPQIDRITPNREAGYPWIRREAIWRGTFHSSPDAKEFAQMKRELKEMMAAMHIPVMRDTECYGRREDP